MSRSGYTDDCNGRELDLWRGAVERAISGKRGQAFLRELADALDRVPVKELIADALVDQDGDRCALGCVAVERGIDVSEIDIDDAGSVGEVFGISRAMASEIMFENDDFCGSPGKRWEYMRRWVASNLRKAEA